MALFYIGYMIAVTSTVAFIVAILTPRWIYPTQVSSSNRTDNSTYVAKNYRGIFYVDEGLADGTCRDWILLYSDPVANCRPPYAVACASLAVAASSLSIILLWLAGGYLYVRRRRLFPSLVTIIALLTFLIFWLSAIIWIVMLTMNRDPNSKINRDQIGFSLWTAVGASGGYLLAFLTFLLYRFTLKRQKPYQNAESSRRF